VTAGVDQGAVVGNRELMAPNRPIAPNIVEQRELRPAERELGRVKRARSQHIVPAVEQLARGPVVKRIVRPLEVEAFSRFVGQIQSLKRN